jgi:hypothetical protein
MQQIAPIVHPTFEITIPSSGKKVTSRPIVTRERKALLTALQSQDSAAIARSVKDIIRACVNGVTVDDLTTFDFEWIFLQLIINSVKETLDLEVRIPNREGECEDCGRPRIMKVNLREAKIERIKRDKSDFVLEISPGFGLKLRYPTEKHLEALDATSKDKSSLEKLTDLIALSIESVFDDTGIKPFSEFDYKSQIEFLDSLPIPVTDKLEAFVNTTPTLALNVTVECPRCKFRAQHIMSGLADFFV